MIYNLSDFSQSAKFDYQMMRRDRAFRRQMLRLTILIIIQEGEHTLEEWVERFSVYCGYDVRSPKDKANLDQCRFYVREIVRGWRHLDEEARDGFIANDIVPSTLALQMAKERKARCAGS